MSGVVRLSGRNAWIPPGWIYDGALERMSAEIRETHPTLSRQLILAITRESIGFLDLTTVGADVLATIEQAASRVRARLLADGASSFGDPAFFPAFVKRLDELLSMLRDDPRLASGCAR